MRFLRNTLSLKITSFVVPRALLRMAVLVLTVLGLAIAGQTVAEAQVTFAGTQVTIAGKGAGNQNALAPAGLALDGKGNAFIADQISNSLIEIPYSSDGFGTPSTLATGLSNPGGVAADWNGNLFVADTGNNRILMLAVNKGAYGVPVTIASGLNSPAAVAVDPSDNIFVADTGNNRIVELPRVGNGYGSLVVAVSGFNGPKGVAVDGAETLYVSDTGNNEVFKEIYSAGGYTTQQLVSRNVLAPTGIAVDQALNVYIADTGNSRILEYPWNGGAKRYNSGATLGSDFAAPPAVAMDWSGHLYVADVAKGRVQEVLLNSVHFPSAQVNESSSTETFNYTVAAGTSIGSIAVYTQGVSGADFIDAGTGSCTLRTYNAATICGVEVSFTPFSSGVRPGAVVLYDPTGNVLATAYFSGIGLAAQLGFLPGTLTSLGSQLSGPSGVTVDGSGNVYIADTGNNRVVEVPFTGSAYGGQITVPIAGLSSPMGMKVDGAGNLFVISNGNDRVIKLPWLGNAFGPQIKVGTGWYGPSDVAVDTTGNVYISNTMNSFLNKLLWTGNGYSQSQFIGNYVKFPVGVTVDSSGDVYFSMPYQNWVGKIPWTGSQYLPEVNIPIFGTSFPSAIAIDANSNLYVVDSGNNRVLMLAWNGVSFASPVTVLAGLNAPSAIAIDGHGNLYIADTGNNQVVKVDLSAPGATAFEDTYLGSTSADSMQVALVENIGNQPLTIDSVSYPVDFPESAGTTLPCVNSTPISRGGVCQLGVNFTPSVVGALQESVAVGANVGNAALAQAAFQVSGNSLGRLEQTISFASIADRTYGAPSISLAAAASSGLAVTYQVLSGPGVVSSNGQFLNITGIGAITIQANQIGSGSYAPAAPVAITFHVLPAVLTVTPNDITATYGAVPSSFNYSISGLVLGQSAGQVVSGKPAIGLNLSGKPGAGTYTLAASQGTLSAANYSFQFASGKLTVNKAVLQVWLISQAAAYGSTAPQMKCSIIGFANGDAIGVVTGAAQVTIPAGTMAAVGTYTILPSIGSLSAANYSFTFVGGTLRVLPAMLTVTANPQTMVYGSALPSLTYSVTGFLRGDTAASAITGTATEVTSATSASSAGSYPITASLGSLKAANYAFQFVQGALTVSKAVLTITPSNASMTYGSKPPSLSYAIAGFVHGDTAASATSGAASMVTQASSVSKPGSYPITATAGWLTARNYTFTFASATLTVNKAALTVKPAAVATIYGAKLPAFSPQYSGFVNGDGVSVVHGAAAFSTTATSASPVGSYQMTAGVGTLSSDSYTFTAGTGTLTVGKAALTVQPSAATSVYGGALPALTYSFAGLVNGDTGSVVSGHPSLTTTATSKSPVGNYAITATAGNLSAANYSFVMASGALSVTRAVLTLTPTTISMTYGATPSLTYALTGFIPGETQKSATTGAPALSIPGSGAPIVGQYKISAAAGTLAAVNYTFQYQTAELTVNKATLTVTADNLSMKAGSAIPTLTYTVSGLLNGDSAAKTVQGTAVLTTTATTSSKAGSYPISIAAGTLAAANYTFTLKNGTLTVQ